MIDISFIVYGCRGGGDESDSASFPVRWIEDAMTVDEATVELEECRQRRKDRDEQRRELEKRESRRKEYEKLRQEFEM